MGKVLILSENDVKGLVTPLESQQAIEQAFQDFANGISRMAQRITVSIPNIPGNMRILPAVKVLPTPRPMPPTRGYLGVKVYTGYVGPAFKDLTKNRFTVLLYDMNGFTGCDCGPLARRSKNRGRGGSSNKVHGP